MRRFTCKPRRNWPILVQEDGLVWHTSEEQAYWNECAYYSFSAKEIETLETATAEVYELLLRAGDVIAKSQSWMDRFGIPRSVQELISKSWEEEPPALNYGRFDWGFNEEGIPKLFEFNCDTPTSLLEASVIQWKWKEQVFPDNDQWNSIHEKIISKFKSLRPYLDPQDTLYFAGSKVEESGEDLITLAYLSDMAIDAGFQTERITMDDIGISPKGEFLDLRDNVIRQIFKLYPWEFMAHEEYVPYLTKSPTVWLEPIWKMMWSNKAILAALYAIEPECPWLLPAYLEGTTSSSYVRKPILSREGANVQVVENNRVIATTGGEYGEEGYVYQDLFRLQNCDGRYPVLGTWIVDGDPAGMGIREDGLITGNVAQFVPHIIE